MPIVPLDMIPLPSLRTYTQISVGLLSVSAYISLKLSTPVPLEEKVSYSWLDSVIDMGYYMIHDPFCIWTLVNMALCLLMLLGTVVRRVVFGELRESEQQHLKDKCCNYIFYKFIFVFGIMNVQYLDEVVLWVTWFTVLGFLQLFAQLGKDRFEYLSFSPTTGSGSHARLLSLLSAIFILSGLMFLICVGIGYFMGFNIFAFMAAECVQLNIRTLHVMLRYVVHLYDVQQGVDVGSVVWEKRGPLAYYTELVFELSVLILDFAHNMHMLLWSNIFLSMASLVICMQLRFLFHEIQSRIRKHRNYLWVLHHMEQNYPMATGEELAEHSDNCAICWEKMESARKLPCSHLFHNSCLLSWLEQDTSCPKCRSALSILTPAAAGLEGLDVAADGQQVPRRPNHFFHFDGSRYVSWLPSFSVEVTRAQVRTAAHAQTSQLDEMARQVTALFPHVPLNAVMDDLRVTRSVDLTVENILDGHLPPAIFRDDAPSGTSLQTPSLMQHWDDAKTDDDEPQGGEVGFCESATERERTLQKRKEQLLMTARRRYLDKQVSPT